jgi:hypothetical protein
MPITTATMLKPSTALPESKKSTVSRYVYDQHKYLRGGPQRRESFLKEKIQIYLFQTFIDPREYKQTSHVLEDRNID